MSEKPFIKLFHSPYHGYFYDVNRDEVVRVEEDVYQYLRAEQEGAILPDDPGILQKIEEYRSFGYLSLRRVGRMEHSATATLPIVLSRCVSSLTLQVTQDCNLNCAYCVYHGGEVNPLQRNHAKKQMPLETAKRAIDFLAEHSVDCDKVSIGYYGGEPLLEFERIKQITAYAEEQLEGKEVQFLITTNATLLSEEKVDYFINHKFSIMISLDGPEEIQDKNRVFAANGKGSFAAIAHNLTELEKKNPDFVHGLSISMVMDPENDFDRISSLRGYPIFEGMPIRATLVDRVYAGGDNPLPTTDAFTEKYQYHMFLSLLASVMDLESPEDCYVSEQTVESFLSAKYRHVPRAALPLTGAPGGPCVPGQQRLFVNVDGEFFPCERVSELSEIMKMGNLENGIDLDKARAILNVGQLTPELCRDCWAFTHCTACVRCMDGGTYFDCEKKKSHCADSCASLVDKIQKLIFFEEAYSMFGGD